MITIEKPARIEKRRRTYPAVQQPSRRLTRFQTIEGNHNFIFYRFFSTDCKAPTFSIPYYVISNVIELKSRNLLDILRAFYFLLFKPLVFKFFVLFFFFVLYALL